MSHLNLVILMWLDIQSSVMNTDLFYFSVHDTWFNYN